MFGSNYVHDISAIDPTTGSRIVIDNGHVAGCRMETDNMYALSIGGNYLFMRQTVPRHAGHQHGRQHLPVHQPAVQVPRRRRLQLGHHATTRTNNGVETMPSTPRAQMGGRCPVVISGTLLFITEPYCLTAIEHY